MFAEIFLKCFPKVSAGSIDHDEGNDVRLPCLHESEGFKSFVHGAEAAWEKGDGVGMFDEVKFASEEVFEGEKFRIAPNGFVGILFEGEFDIEGKAVLPACPCLGGAHDAITSAGDDHVARFLHQLAEAVGGLEGGMGGLGAGGTEYGDFFNSAIRSKDDIGIADFSHDTFKLLKITDIGAIGAKTQSNRDHLLKELRLFGNPSLLNKLFYLAIQWVRELFMFFC